ncbi:hypothetical protein HDU87_000471 [Geranomyces variabilis]|uniref:NAD(P)-binding domain-containing protein n=1 Tax=Geranomyces variabilis TaxID=109894 RepID=A0AAD5XIS0_9FUNG|nr:hypothetical protein HDU87_000471 [Geranomyces variabilis]
MTRFLIVGITGGFGGAVFAELSSTVDDSSGSSDIQIRALVRSAEKAQARFGKLLDTTELIQGDVLDYECVDRAVKGCCWVVFAVNYPYSQWHTSMPSALRNVVKACQRHQVGIVFPGNVYSLKPVFNTPLSESHPAEPVTTKGQIRKDLESILKDSNLRVLIIRANDYFGPTARNGILDRVFGNSLKGKRQQLFGTQLDNVKQMVYLPDLARATIQLALRHYASHNPALFTCYHFGGYVETRRKFSQIVKEETIKLLSDVKVSPRGPVTIPWPLLRLAGMLDPEARELVEMRYLHDRDFRLDDTLLRRELDGFELIPLRDAIVATLQSYSGGMPSSLPCKAI